ncbi:MAG TPA: cytochrome c [Usitatibacter sp.]|jgi:mono/diheme cytochrome c family protein|nr:cytochrome c [Usitatibacter sp.]
MKGRLVFAMLALLALPAAAQVPAGDVARGKAAFMKNMCYTCHGTAGQGGDRGSGPRIAYDVWPWEGFAQQVRRPREAMPRYPVEHLPDQDLADIYAYVASFKKGPKASEIPLLK